MDQTRVNGATQVSFMGGLSLCFLVEAIALFHLRRFRKRVGILDQSQCEYLMWGADNRSY